MAARDEDGLWVLEGQCGDCGHVEVEDARPVALDGPRIRAAHRKPTCHGFYKGRPRNRCGWKLTWLWAWVPTAKAIELCPDAERWLR